MNIFHRVCACLLFASGVGASEDELRTRAGLQVLLDFTAPKNGIILDRSEMGPPIELKIETPKAVQFEKGGIQFVDRSIVRSVGRALKIHQASSWTNELTVEVWLEPADTSQKGPARVVSFSRNGSQRNFTLGQDGNKFDFRLRTSRTSENGIPSLSTKPGSVKTGLTHVVYTRNRGGTARLYLDGKPAAEAVIAGDFSNWDVNFRLIIGNEHSGDRTWKGKLHLVAIYNRALSGPEILKNFTLGPGSQTPPVKTIQVQPKDLFKTAVAPLLARHCLECHDSANRKGGLDLSTRTAAFKGGESGTPIVAGKPGESLVWQAIHGGEMPADRPPLSDREKQDLRKWIKLGANWSVAKVDPAVFLRNREVDSRLLRRLTVNEYIAAVKVAAGVDIAKRARELLPKDLRADGFNNTAYNLNVDLKHIEVYSRLAHEIVQQVSLPDYAKRFAKTKKLDDNHLREIIATMGKWVLRGPLEEYEIVAFLGIAQTVRHAGGNFDQAIGLLLESMLQSPRFLYQVERQRGDGTMWPVEPHTLACRASFVVWGSPPDEELFQLAESGRILDAGVYQQQIARMLKDPRAVSRSKQFVSQWLHLSRLDNLNPNRKKFPHWDPQLASDMKRETLAVWDEVIWKQGRSLASLFAAEVTFVTPALAKHYGMKLPGNLEPGFNRIPLTDTRGRRGILTHGSLLSIGGDEASMVSRGLFILDDILRGVVKDPPPCVDTTPVPTKAGFTQRSIALRRIADKNCGGCHGRFEPLAFGFEKFDGLGRFHEKDEHGNVLKEHGKIKFPGDAKETGFRTSKELASLISKSTRVSRTLTWKLTQFSLGRPLGPDDIDVVNSIHRKSQQLGGTYPGVVNSILTSDLILKARTEPYPEGP